MAQLTPARKLFDLLVSRDFDPEMLDVSGKPAPDPAEAEIFSFDFRAQSGKDYGTVVIMLSTEGDLEVYCADNVGKTMEGSDKTEWFQFLEQLKNFAVRNNRMTFGIKNLNHLRYSMQGQAAIKEGLFESWSGKRDVSYNAGATESRLMIKHKRNLGEDEARFRYVESLFIETAEGERYKLPFKNLTAGKAMLEHVRNGGRPYDIRGQHIVEMVNELTVLSRFRRANTGKLLEGDTATLVEQTNAYYENLQHNLKSLTSQRGYDAYFESWAPTDISEESMVIEGLKHLFVTQSIDQRIEDALPLIARIQQQGTAMKEANIFEAWAERLVEGTWSTPDTPEKQQQLIELMSQDLPVGADATNATEQLYDLIGDDELFDQLQALAEQDANADARDLVYERLQELADRDPNINAVLQAIGADTGAEEDGIGSMGMTKDEYFKNNPDSPAAENPNNKLAEDSLRSIRHAAGLTESRLMDDTGETIEHILNRFKHEVKQFEAGSEMDDDLYHALYDYWADAGEIPYGVQKARDGDPYEWVAQNLQSHLSGGGIVGGNPDEDYGIERESVEHGDYAEEKSRMRELAGLAPEETDEGVLGTVGGAMGGGMLGTLAGGAIGGVLGGPAGAVLGAQAGQGIGTAAGAVGGQELTKGGSSIIEQGEEETDEGYGAASVGDKIGSLAGTAAGAGLGALAGPTGMVAGGLAGNLAGGAIGSKIGGAMEEEEANEGWKGQLAGGTLGSIAGGLAGAATPIPGGALIGGALGGTAGQMLGDKLGGEEETDEGKLGAVGGGVLGMAATKSLKGGVAGAKLGSAIQDRFAKKDDASPLAGQYGHSGKMKEVSKDTSFLDRLKELSGMKK